MQSNSSIEQHHDCRVQGTSHRAEKNPEVEGATEVGKNRSGNHGRVKAT